MGCHVHVIASSQITHQQGQGNIALLHPIIKSLALATKDAIEEANLAKKSQMTSYRRRVLLDLVQEQYNIMTRV